MKRLILLLAVVVIELQSLDGPTFYFPVDAIGPFRTSAGCPGTVIYTVEGSFCVKDLPEDVAKKLREAPDDKE